MVVWEAIFPTPVLRTNIGRDFTAEERSFVVNMQATVRPNVFNLRCEDTHILDAVEMHSIRSFLEDSLDQYARKIISSDSRHQFNITQSWLNYTRAGQSHHRHAHTNSLVSGVLYLNADKETDSIHFYRTASPQITVSDEQLNWYNATSWRFSVGSGELLMFPSTLVHEVQQMTGGHMRVSLSFNAFVRGEIGADEKLNHLKL